MLLDEMHALDDSYIVCPSSHLHDVSHDDTVDQLRSHIPRSESSFSGVFGQIRGAVLPQNPSIRPERCPLSRDDEHTYTNTQREERDAQFPAVKVQKTACY